MGIKLQFPISSVAKVRRILSCNVYIKKESRSNFFLTVTALSFGRLSSPSTNLSLSSYCAIVQMNPNMSQIADAGSNVLRLIALSVDIIKALNRLCNRYIMARVRLHGVIINVTILRTVLRRINELARSETLERHHQLVMDFETSLAFCKTVLEKLNASVQDLTKDGKPAEPAFHQRFMAIFSTASLNDMESILDRQVGTLNLLLSVYLWYVLVLFSPRLSPGLVSPPHH